jgi:hypothetical protein
VLPLPSYVKVTNLSNGRSVIVRVNDRGPFLEERIIDLSYVAAYQLGFINDGSTMVEVEAILPGDKITASAPVIAATEPPPRAGSLETGESGIFLQLGAFSARDNAQACVPRLPGWATPSICTRARTCTGCMPALTQVALRPTPMQAASIRCSAFHHWLLNDKSL